MTAKNITSISFYKNNYFPGKKEELFEAFL